MNQKDYKKIAEIIKQQYYYSTESQRFRIRRTAEDLADYFEEEDNWETELHYCEKCNKLFDFAEIEQEGAPISGTYWVSPCCRRDVHWEDNIFEIKEPNFNRKQFLKLCGVEEK